jgi:hypothetical protein
MKVLVLVLALMLGGCGMLPKQTTEVGTGAQQVESVVNQQADAAEGAKVQAEAVGDVTTKNVDGIPVWWFMVGCLVFGAIVPQPRFLRWIW